MSTDYVNPEHKTIADKIFCKHKNIKPNHNGMKVCQDCGKIEPEEFCECLHSKEAHQTEPAFSSLKEYKGKCYICQCKMYHAQK